MQIVICILATQPIASFWNFENVRFMDLIERMLVTSGAMSGAIAFFQ